MEHNLQQVTFKLQMKIISIGLLPIFVATIFLVAVQYYGFPIMRALTERIDTTADGYVVVTKAFYGIIETSSRPATESDMQYFRGRDRFLSWTGLIVFFLILGLGTIFVIAGFLPSDNRLVQWVACKASAPPTRL